MPKLLLCRHGQTEWNVTGHLQGQRDSALTRQGRAESAAQGRVLSRELDLDNYRIFASPLGRVQQTLDIALRGLDLPVHSDPRLMEVDVGAWTGLNGVDIEAGWPTLYAGHTTKLALTFAAPDGENFDAVAARGKAFLAELTEPALLFTHGATMAVLRGLALGLGYEQTLELDHQQGVVYKIEANRETVLTA